MKIDNHKIKLTTTLGPVSSSVEMIKELVKTGATTIRVNFSHGSVDEQVLKFDAARQAAKELNTNISLLLDTKGPEIRVGKMRDGAVAFAQNQSFKILTTPEAFATVIGDEKQVCVPYDMSKDLKVGDKVLFDDGKLTTTVTNVIPGEITVLTANAHTLKTNKRINLPNVEFSLPFLDAKDITDVTFGAKYGVDYIAASFVNSAKNVKELRDLLDKNGGKNIQIISKIESQMGINNIDEIIEASDGIMIARGDLGLEIPYWEVPYWEIQIVKKCRALGKIVVVATQMLDSLENNPQPTRAEVSDVYWATSLGADSTMLSNETAAGKYPIRAVEVMRTINKKAEYDYFNTEEYNTNINSLISQFVVDGDQAVLIKNIIKTTQNGDYKYCFVVTDDAELLHKLSRFRVDTMFIGIINNEQKTTSFGLNSGIKIAPKSVELFSKLENNAQNTEILEELVEFNPGDNYLIVINNEIKHKKFN
ncbi:pyruvate kinase [Mycoplasmopsis mucosicanis]|uniref:Pyruvate kinase n=1 Tax=Mycoplasmopsis mucosicanis TaxID=458208 RepID=A0A507SQT9_9BACT|nr:pyruvate kinase [Mycoplasmopsis mucosicanis]TQC54157.1 pyruvate kinase [Mycoplasmopsis mucosicanis]